MLGGINGRIRRLLVAAAFGLGALIAPTAASAETVVFNYNGTDGTDGSPQLWTVPAGVTSATFVVSGARAGAAVGKAPLGGFGANVHAVLAVTPGAELRVTVGGRPFGVAADLGGFNGGGAAGGSGGGGGGASDVRTGADLAGRILVAAGGGGSGSSGPVPSGEGGNSGADGIGGDSQGIAGAFAGGGQPGLAGTSTAGGGAGAGGIAPGYTNGEDGLPGAEGAGGAGGAAGGPFQSGGGGGGGGGLYGGGGGGAGGWGPFPFSGGGGGGGGGSSYAHPAASEVAVAEGANNGHGQVVIRFQPASAPPSGAPRPNTRITKKPGGNRKRKRRWVFEFEDELPGINFLCRLDKRPFEPCTSPKTYKGLEPGRHTFRVKSVDQNGVESTPRTAKFRVRGVR